MVAPGAAEALERERAVFDFVSAGVLFVTALGGSWLPRYLSSRGGESGTDSAAFHLMNMLSGGGKRLEGSGLYLGSTVLRAPCDATVCPPCLVYHAAPRLLLARQACALLLGSAGSVRDICTMPSLAYQSRHVVFSRCLT